MLLNSSSTSGLLSRATAVAHLLLPLTPPSPLCLSAHPCLLTCVIVRLADYRRTVALKYVSRGLQVAFSYVSLTILAIPFVSFGAVGGRVRLFRQLVSDPMTGNGVHHCSCQFTLWSTHLSPACSRICSSSCSTFTTRASCTS